ncbi:hypothetical protein [Streptomyces cinereoruber]|uniref:hypothetical protein n=1 Tax=Streptomyces cinereoruber TaxID=67260 RepID=UPI0036374D80
MAEDTYNTMGGRAEVVVQARRTGELHRHLHGVVEVSDAVAELLDGLGVAPARLERSFAGRSKQYWTRTRDKRIVVIDNARYGAEVGPLLLASAGGLVVVTSQGPLHDLDGVVVVEVPVEPLAVEDAVRLLGHIVDDPG